MDTVGDLFAPIRNLFHADTRNGYAPWQLDMAEARLGWRLPGVLRGYYEWFGHHEQINQMQDYLIEPDKLKWDGDALPIFHENQYVCRWYLRRSDSESDNPSVWYDDLCGVNDLSHGTLSDFLVSMAFYNAVATLPEMADECLSLAKEEGAFESIAKLFKPVGVPMPLRCNGIRFFANTPDSVLGVFGADSGSYVFMWAASTVEELQDMTRRIEMITAEYGIYGA